MVFVFVISLHKDSPPNLWSVLIHLDSDIFGLDFIIPGLRLDYYGKSLPMDIWHDDVIKWKHFPRY